MSKYKFDKSPSFYEKYVKICDWLESRGIWYESSFTTGMLDRFDAQKWLIYRDDCYVVYLREFRVDLYQQLIDQLGLDYMIFPKGAVLMVCLYQRGKLELNSTDIEQIIYTDIDYSI